jgi:hypothetical protein
MYFVLMPNLFSNYMYLENVQSDRSRSAHSFDVAMMDFRDSEQVIFA